MVYLTYLEYFNIKIKESKFHDNFACVLKCSDSVIIGISTQFPLTHWSTDTLNHVRTVHEQHFWGLDLLRRYFLAFSQAPELLCIT